MDLPSSSSNYDYVFEREYKASQTYHVTIFMIKTPHAPTALCVMSLRQVHLPHTC